MTPNCRELRRIVRDLCMLRHSCDGRTPKDRLQSAAQLVFVVYADGTVGRPDAFVPAMPSERSLDEDGEGREFLVFLVGCSVDCRGVAPPGRSIRADHARRPHAGGPPRSLLRLRPVATTAARPRRAVDLSGGAALGPARAHAESAAGLGLRTLVHLLCRTLRGTGPIFRAAPRATGRRFHGSA